MEHQLKVGDVVQLKSGGPHMTINTIGNFGMGSTHEQASCVWFDGKKRMEDVFELHALCIPEPTRAFSPTYIKSDYP